MINTKSFPIQVVERYHPDNTIAQAGWIWVFDSNLAGRHGMGAGAIAHVNFKAQYGVGEGATGRAYAIPTKDHRNKVLPLELIKKSVELFLDWAKLNPVQKFFLTRVGCGVSGYPDDQIAPLFRGAASNCCLPDSWEKVLR